LRAGEISMKLYLSGKYHIMKINQGIY